MYNNVNEHQIIKITYNHKVVSLYDTKQIGMRTTYGQNKSKTLIISRLHL